MFRRELPQAFHVGARVVVNLALLRQAHPIRPDVMRREDDPFRADGLEIREQFSVMLLDLFLVQSGVVDEFRHDEIGLLGKDFLGVVVFAAGRLGEITAGVTSAPRFGDEFDPRLGEACA